MFCYTNYRHILLTLSFSITDHPLKQNRNPNSSGIDIHGPLYLRSGAAHVRSGLVSAHVFIIIFDSSRGLSPDLGFGDHSIERKISHTFPNASLKPKPHHKSAAEIDNACDGMVFPGSSFLFSFGPDPKRPHPAQPDRWRPKCPHHGQPASFCGLRNRTRG